MSPPQRFGDYAILGEIARGGQGVVYRAQHPSGAPVALKVLLEPSDSALKRFAQEARVLGKLVHPNLLRVYEHGEHEGTHFLAVEWIDGQDLYALTREHGLPRPDWIARTLIAVALALEFCHQRGVIHRDLKPANVLIERATQRAVLVDFGLVKRDPNRMHLTSLDEGTAMSQSGLIKGTPEYMAPEQVNTGEFGDVSAATDVYGLGAVLYHLLTGSPPFTGRAAVVVMRKVTRKAPTDPRERNPDAPPSLAELCLRCLAKHSADRPATPLAFAAALAQAAGLPPPKPPTPPSSGTYLQTESDSGPPGGDRFGALPPRLPSDGETFAGLQIVNEIARGGSGAVFVTQDSNGAAFALKVLVAGVREETKLKRFEREAQVGRELKHPNVVSVLRSGVENGMAFLVMEYLQGALPLDEYVERNTLDVAARLGLVLQVVEAVEAAHALDLIHRDLKPDNILVLPGDRVKVVDFGLARHMDRERLTMSGAVMGTVHYMAPEQVLGKAFQADARTDVYAVGVILYELISGSRPYEGGSAVELMAGILTDTPPDPCQGVDDAPHGLREVILKAMARGPDDRYATAAALGRDLAALSANSGSVSALDEHRQRSRQRALLFTLLGGVALAVAIATIGLLAQRSTTDPQAIRREAKAVSQDALGLLGERAPLANGADAVRALRQRLDALPRDVSEAERALATASLRIRVLEGLVALASERPGEAQQILERLDPNDPGVTPLAGAVAALTSDGDPARGAKLLSQAILRGVKRPELRAWRARARQRAGLEPRHVDEVLEDLKAAETSQGLLTSEQHCLRAHALVLGGDPEGAAAELEGLEASLDLRWTVALARAMATFDRDPAQALELLRRLPPQTARDPAQWTLGNRAKRELSRKVDQNPKTEAELGELLVLCRLVRLLLHGDPLDAKLAAKLSNICTGFDLRGTSSTGLLLSSTLASLCQNSVKIQREVAYQIQRFRSRTSKAELLPSLRRLIEIEPVEQSRVEHQLLLAKTLADLVANYPEPETQATEANELRALLTVLEPELQDPRSEWIWLQLRSSLRRAEGDLYGALADLDQALSTTNEPGLHYERLQVLTELKRSREGLPNALAFLFAQNEGSHRFSTVSTLVWEQRALEPAEARRASEHHVTIEPTSAFGNMSLAWFVLPSDPPRALKALRVAQRTLATSSDDARRELAEALKDLVERLARPLPDVDGVRASLPALIDTL